MAEAGTGLLLLRYWHFVLSCLGFDCCGGWMDGLSGVNCVPHPVEQNHSDPPHNDEPLFVDTPCRGWVGDFPIYLLPLMMMMMMAMAMLL